MKKTLVLTLIICAFLASCKEKATKIESKEKLAYVTFGDKIVADGAITKEEMFKKYETMSISDTIDVKFSTEITEVCQKKGCWAKVPLADGAGSFVKFKDYGFFLPMNAGGSAIILNGKAFKSETSVEELKHYAQDAGKSAAEIAEITTPKATYSFIADGVLLATKEVNE